MPDRQVSLEGGWENISDVESLSLGRSPSLRRARSLPTPGQGILSEKMHENVWQISENALPGHMLRDIVGVNFTVHCTVRLLPQ